MKKKEPKMESFVDKLKSKLSLSKHSSVGDAMNQIVDDSDEEYNRADF